MGDATYLPYGQVFRNGELATASGANLAFFNGSASIGLPVRSPYNSGAPSTRRRETRATERHRSRVRIVVDRSEKPCDTLKFASGLDPDESSKPLRTPGQLLCGNRPFDSRRLIAGPRGCPYNGESNLQVYAPSNATGRQLTITKIAHTTGVVGDLGMAARRFLAACDMPAERRRATALDRASSPSLARGSHAPRLASTPGRISHRESRRLPRWFGRIQTRPERWQEALALWRSPQPSRREELRIA